MFETGVYKHIYSIIYPDLPQCSKTKTFQSARLADLSTAFFIVIFGWVASLGIMISECIWKKRSKIYHNLKKRIANNFDDVNINSNLQCSNNLNNHFGKPMYRMSNTKNTLILPPSKNNMNQFDFLN
ncbi:unnamed protein product [Psylliodes chrysocephalus]|uniref:Uncharacterized protein n=1 Tax=Psylliodes chrysocephalus TaxID=3402493 RepID=A0A9P0CFM1_9CUCU|nr:unnamed protein product [Psylliodes chrysocephala]